MKGIVFKGRGRQPWRWQIVARNGEVIAHGEGHATQWHAVRAFTGVVRSIVRGAGQRAGGALSIEFATSARGSTPVRQVWTWRTDGGRP